MYQHLFLIEMYYKTGLYWERHCKMIIQWDLLYLYSVSGWIHSWLYLLDCLINTILVLFSTDKLNQLVFLMPITFIGRKKMLFKCIILSNLDIIAINEWLINDGKWLEPEISITCLIESSHSLCLSSSSRIIKWNWNNDLLVNYHIFSIIFWIYWQYIAESWC